MVRSQKLRPCPLVASNLRTDSFDIAVLSQECEALRVPFPHLLAGLLFARRRSQEREVIALDASW
jgi:hypothetical protein